jgi:hypothetical protein
MLNSDLKYNSELEYSQTEANDIIVYYTKFELEQCWYLKNHFFGEKKVLGFLSLEELEYLVINTKQQILCQRAIFRLNII